MGQTCNTGSEGSSYIGIDQSHLSCFIVSICHACNESGSGCLHTEMHTSQA